MATKKPTRGGSPKSKGSTKGMGNGGGVVNPPRAMPMMFGNDQKPKAARPSKKRK